MKRYPLILALVAMMTILSTILPTGTAAGAAVKSFPGAAGFGADTPGGRGGKVIAVTNLNDSGAGSLREALSTSGARTVVFRVAGTIALKNDLVISQPFITVAGQTAPGQGVQIKGGMIKVETHDVVLRYLKVREGNPTGGNPADTDAVSVAGNRTEVYNVIIDHCTLIWGTDIGGMSILTNAHNVTVQDSIIGEGLYGSTHPESPHSTSLNLTQLNDSGYPTRITLYHNLITSSDTRNPQIIQAAEVDMINNVIYNWGTKSAYGNPKSLNLVSNTYVKGPMSKANYFWDLRVDADYPTQNNNAVFQTGNQAVGFTGTLEGPSSIYVTSPKFMPSVLNPTSAQDAYNYVVSNVGANRPVRDAVDQRIVSNLTSRSMKLPNGASNRFVDNADLVWPDLSGGTAPADSDNDGMADSWEQQYFGSTSKGSATNSASDTDGDGWTDLEEYLNGTSPIDGGGSAPANPNPTEPPALPTLQPTSQPTAQPTSQPTAQPTTQPTVSAPASGGLVFTPSDDASVFKAQVTSNQGAAQVLTVDDSPKVDSYLKFNVAGVSGRKVAKVVLRLYVVDGADKGGRLKVVPSANWSEKELTWKNKPDSPGDAIAQLGKVNAGGWYELDVTSAVAGDGTYSFRLVSPSADSAGYSSKEGGNPPQLVVTLAP